MFVFWYFGSDDFHYISMCVTSFYMTLPLHVSSLLETDNQHLNIPSFRRALLWYLVLLHSRVCLSSNGLIPKPCIHLRQYTSPIFPWSSLNRLCGPEYLWCWGCNLPICFRIFVPSPDSFLKSQRFTFRLNSAPWKQWQRFSHRFKVSVLGIGTAKWWHI